MKEILEKLQDRLVRAAQGSFLDKGRLGNLLQPGIQDSQELLLEAGTLLNKMKFVMWKKGEMFHVTSMLSTSSMTSSLTSSTKSQSPSSLPHYITSTVLVSCNNMALKFHNVAYKPTVFHRLSQQSFP